MSSTATQSKTVSAPTKPSAPIEPLNTDLAKVYKRVHPILLTSVFLLNFSRVVADPVSALAWTLPVVAALQIVYCIICLPPAGCENKKMPKMPKRKHPSTHKPLPSDPTLQTKLMTAALALLLSASLGTTLLTTLLILFGAPLTTHHAHTLLAGAHISIISAIPLLYVHGVNATKWWEIGCLALPGDEVFGAAVGACVGSWMGAVPIPLDWDREWQKWPVTIVAGAYAGYAVGKLLGGTALKGKKISLDP